MTVKKGEGSSASGSDMSTILATWSYILPSLNYIMRDPVSTPDGRAPVLPVAQHAGIYTVVYNFATASRTGIAGVPGFGMTGATGMRDGFDAEKEAAMDKFERVRAMIGYELYSLLDDYFRDLAREIRMNAPLPHSSAVSTETSLVVSPKASGTSAKSKGKVKAVVPAAPTAVGDELPLLAYYSKAYTRFSSGAAQINRLFAYLNRHFIMRAIDEGCGWISLADVVAASVLRELAAVSISTSTAVTKPKRERSFTTSLTSNKKSKEDIKKLEARKHAEWRKWGYDASTPRETDEEMKEAEQERKIAELCAEAASSPERIVTCSALAMRSWRLEVAEPLLDPLFWNTNGRKDGWIGTAPIPPTPVEFADNKERAKNGTDSDTASDVSGNTAHATAHATFSVPIAIPSPGARSGASTPALDGDEKGKGKGKSAPPSYYDMAVSIPVSIPLSPSLSNPSNTTLPVPRITNDDEPSGQGNGVNGSSPNGTHSPDPSATSTVVSPTAVKNKRPLPRKNGMSNSPKVSLAAVRAATAARAAEKDGEHLSPAIPEASLAQKGRLTRAVTYLLEARAVYEITETPSTEGLENGTIEDTAPAVNGSAVQSVTMSLKALYASTVADSLMMCGISPDKTIRRKLDRFITKVERGDRRFKGNRW